MPQGLGDPLRLPALMMQRAAQPLHPRSRVRRPGDGTAQLADGQRRTRRNDPSHRCHQITHHLSVQGGQRKEKNFYEWE